MATTAEKNMSKMEAVRRGLSDLGKDAKPVQLQAHIKEKFGIEMSTDHISTYKGTILKAKKTTKKSPKVSSEPIHAGSNGSQVAKPAKVIGLAEQVAMLKSVAASIGKDEAKKIIDLL